jgi:hypothetical protein
MVRCSTLSSAKLKEFPGGALRRTECRQQLGKMNEIGAVAPTLHCSILRAPGRNRPLRFALMHCRQTNGLLLNAIRVDLPRRVFINSNFRLAIPKSGCMRL